MLGADVDLDLFVHHPDPRPARLGVADGGGRIKRRAALLHRAQHGARGVIAADPLQAVDDLALPLAV